MSSLVARALDSDLWFSFKNTPIAIIAAVVAFLLIAGAFLAPVIAPHTPFDLATLNLND